MQASFFSFASQLQLTHNHTKQLKGQQIGHFSCFSFFFYLCFYIAIYLDMSIIMTLINEFAWLREAVSLFTFILSMAWFILSMALPKKTLLCQQGLDKPQLVQTKH